VKIEGPHEIVPAAEIPRDKRRGYVQLCDEDFQRLQGMTEAQRAAWVRERVPAADRLAAALEEARLPALAARARAGQFTPGQPGARAQHARQVLRHELADARRKAARRAGDEHADKVFAIEALERRHEAGEFHDSQSNAPAVGSAEGG
jgi:hypothetical protein